MNLKDLGFDDWFHRVLTEFDRPDHRLARVTAVNRDSFAVRNEDGEAIADVTGRLMFTAESSTDLPVVGDWAFVKYYNDDTLAIIDELLPRKSVLKRKTSGKKIDFQMMASNIDTAFIVQSCDANFNLRRLERYLVMVRDGDMEPALLLSKTDLISDEEVEQRISAVRDAHIDCTLIAFSNESGSGLDLIERTLKPGKTYCLLGSSGVGKTTLLNRLVGRDAFVTEVVREKDGKGRHATSRRQLVVLDSGAMIIDTPGMRELGTIDVGAGIDESFSDIQDLAGGCRFHDCTHTSEAGCAVLSAIENGELSEKRLQNYIKLLKESEYHRMSYVEKRKKDRKFGQYVKSVMKHQKKK